MGRNKNCIYPSCKSDSRRSDKPHMHGVSFIPFPKPISKPVLCFKWLKWLKEVRKDYTRAKITKSTYLCTKHFVGLKGPTREFPNPVHPNSLVSLLKPASEQSLIPENLSSFEETPQTNAESNENNSSELVISLQDSAESMDIGDLNSFNVGMDNTLSNFIANPTIHADHNIGNEINSTMIVYAETEDQNVRSIIEDKNVLNNPQMIIEKNFYKEFLASPIWMKLITENWLSNLSNVKNNKVQFLKVMKDTNMPLISITVNEDHSVEGRVHEKNLANHPLVEIPETISSAFSLSEFLTNINKLKVCQGIKEPKLLDLLKARSRGNYGFNVTRDDNCVGLSRNKTCIHCAKLKSYALKTIAQREKRQTQKKYKSLSKEELIILLKKSQADLRKARRQIKKRQKKDSERLVDEDDNNSIDDILKQSNQTNRKNHL